MNDGKCHGNVREHNHRGGLRPESSNPEKPSKTPGSHIDSDSQVVSSSEDSSESKTSVIKDVNDIASVVKVVVVFKVKHDEGSIHSPGVTTDLLGTEIAPQIMLVVVSLHTKVLVIVDTYHDYE